MRSSRTLRDLVQRFGDEGLEASGASSTIASFGAVHEAVAIDEHAGVRGARDDAGRVGDLDIELEPAAVDATEARGRGDVRPNGRREVVDLDVRADRGLVRPERRGDRGDGGQLAQRNDGRRPEHLDIPRAERLRCVRAGHHVMDGRFTSDLDTHGLDTLLGVLVYREADLPKSVQAWVGEFVGTFIFVSLICAAVILTQVADGGIVGVAFAHFLALGAAVTAFGGISGGHFNPAVTLSAWIGRRISSADAVGYMGSQILGAVMAAIFLRVTFEESAWGISNLATPALGTNVSDGQAFLLEAVLTFILVTVVWATGIDDRSHRVGGFAIGGVLGAMILGFGPLTGVGLNPARYLGPAAVSSEMGDFWIYILAPLVGAAVAGILYGYAWSGGFPWKATTGDDSSCRNRSGPSPRRHHSARSHPLRPGSSSRRRRFAAHPLVRRRRLASRQRGSLRRARSRQRASPRARSRQRASGSAASPQFSACTLYSCSPTTSARPSCPSSRRGTTSSIRRRP